MDATRSTAPQRRSAAVSAVLLDVSPTIDAAWLFVEEGFEPRREHEIESLFSVGNGYVGTRGSLPEGMLISTPATFVAGVYVRPPATAAVVSVLSIATIPDWTRFAAEVDTGPLSLERGEILEHRRILDVRQGIWWREWRHRDPRGRVTRVRMMRLASLADRHLLVQSVTLTPENYRGRLRVDAHIAWPPDAQVAALPPSSETLLVEEIAAPGATAIIAVAVASRVHGGSREPHLDGAAPMELDVDLGAPVRFERRVSVYTSRDGERPAERAGRHLAASVEQGVEQLVAVHAEGWRRRWEASQVEVEGDPAATRALRFACYHLISAANPDDDRVSVGARALTGSVYRGHVFWDAEIYMLPFYVFTHPPTARALLMYRYHTLGAARAKAASIGCRGALFAWESADTGEEMTPHLTLTPDGQWVPVLGGQQEHHVDAAVAFGVWQYWQATGDDDFFADHGAEILVETARFWATRGRLDAGGRYHIRCVMGPDEYHDAVDDSAYTNGMARWNLELGADAAAIVRERWPERWRALSGRLRIDPRELDEWSRLASAMCLGRDDQTLLYEQFTGYAALEEIDIAAFEPRSAPLDVLLGRARTRASKVIKQADVVLLLALLWDRFTPEERERNFRYYEARCDHGSSLSPPAHALVAARLGDTALAARYFRETAEIDLAKHTGSAAGGVHAAALGGLWQAAVLGFAGLRLVEGGVSISPRLPAGWRGLRFPIMWRGRTLRTEIRIGEAGRIEVEISVEGEDGMRVGIEGGEETNVRAGRRYRSRLAGRHWTPWAEER